MFLIEYSNSSPFVSTIPLLKCFISIFSYDAVTYVKPMWNLCETYVKYDRFETQHSSQRQNTHISCPARQDNSSRFVIKRTNNLIISLHRICIFISSKMVAEYICASDRSFVDVVIETLFCQFQHPYHQTAFAGINVLYYHFRTIRYRYGRPRKVKWDNQIVSICVFYHERDVLACLVKHDMCVFCGLFHV